MYLYLYITIGSELKWYNMYGAPIFKQESAIENLKKGASSIAKKAKQG